MSSESVEQIYRAHHSWLKSWFWRRLGTSHDADDLAHDTFLRLIATREAHLLREPRAFLSTLAGGLLANHWRRQAIEKAYLEALAAQPQSLEPSAEDRALIIEALCEVDRMLASLPAKARKALLLVQLDGLTQAEVAAELGVSDRMVRKYLADAMLHCAMLKAGVTRT